MVCFKCNICGQKDFAGIDEVNHHIRRNHRKSCEYCGLIFYRQNNLDVHIRHVHNGVPWLPPQYGAGDTDITYSCNQFDVYQIQTKTNRLGFSENTYRVKFKNLKPSINDTIIIRLDFLKKMMYKIIKVFKSKMYKTDTGQLILYGNPEALKSAFSTPFMMKSEFNYDYVAQRMSELLNSNEHFQINNEMFIDFKIIKASGGRGISLKNTPDFLKLLLKKKVYSVIKGMIIFALPELFYCY